MPCRSGAQATVQQQHTSRAGSPWENPFLELFNGRRRNKFLNIEIFSSLPEAKLLAEQHRIEYNVYRPHSALQGSTPLEVLQQWKAA
jgi:transposase InsO family protein